MENKRKNSVINVIIMLVLCVVMSGLIIVLSNSKTSIELSKKSTSEIKNNYSTEQASTNTWDISATKNDNVVAILSDDGTLTISGTGNMKNWNGFASVAWDNVKSKIKKVIIEDGVTSIGNYAFYNCTKLTSIEISSSVTNIGKDTLRVCYNLTSIEVNENNTSYMDDNGVLYTKDGTQIIKYPEGKKEAQYTILSTVTRIGVGAFYDCDSLTNIIIPKSVTSIGECAFQYCDSLTEIEIPESVTSIGEWAFLGCKITELSEERNNNIELPDFLKRAQDENDILYSSSGFEFENCVIDDSMIKINEGESYARLEVINGKLGGLIYTVSYKSWDVSENGDGSVVACLSDNGVLTISGTGNMEDYATTYDHSLWYDIGIEEKIKIVIIKDGVTNIGDYAFAYCYNLIEIEISSTVTEIGDTAFSYCESFTNIKVNENNPSYVDCDGVLYTKDKTEIIKYPEGKKETEYTILSSVKTIGDAAFEECDSLRNIIIPDSVTNIGNGAFCACYSLTSIVIPESVTSIGDWVFAGCYSLTEVEISNSVTEIGNATFGDCYNLTEIKIPEKVTSIGYWAFAGCHSLTNIIIPGSVTSIGYGAFEDCENLSSIVIQNEGTCIATNVFVACDNLTIWCKKDSTAYTYAQENEIDYLIIMDGIKPKTTVEQLSGAFEVEAEYETTDKNGEVITDIEFVTTGCRVKTTNGENYIIVVTGDSNGDGETDIKDILQINKHRLNKAKLTVEYLLAADVNGDEKVDLKDILQINKFRLGKIEKF